MTELGPGPWQDEPDRLEWRSEGLPCLIVRNDLGALCGYVGVPPGHPWHGKDYEGLGAHAHGGLTFAGSCHGPICHVPQPGEPDDVWWLGFDCAHAGAGDLLPRMAALWDEVWSRGDTYKPLAYVRAEVERLAEQARGAK